MVGSDGGAGGVRICRECLELCREAIAEQEGD